MDCLIIIVGNSQALSFLSKKIRALQIKMNVILGVINKPPKLLLLKETTTIRLESRHLPALNHILLIPQILALMTLTALRMTKFLRESLPLLYFPEMPHLHLLLKTMLERCWLLTMLFYKLKRERGSTGCSEC